MDNQGIWSFSSGKIYNRIYHSLLAQYDNSNHGPEYCRKNVLFIYLYFIINNISLLVSPLLVLLLFQQACEHI